TLLTPHTELSDKLLIEVARGCSEMCRFCWAAYAMAPQVRIPAEAVLEVARRNRALTSRAGLIATAVADHPEILPILRGLSALDFHIALSSVKIDAISPEILAILTVQGERALAIAPEAGNERLRLALNKKVSDAMLREKVRLIAASGITQLKLYLQIGLPGETDEDVGDLVMLVDDLRRIFLDEGRKRGRVGTLVPNVNAFIPKPHTPFENEVLDDPDSIARKLKLLDEAFRKMPNVTFRGMPVVEAVWEAYLAKMGLESGPILRDAAAGVPIRRLVKEHRETILSVIRPARQAHSGPPSDLPRGVFDPHARQASPWGFIHKS
ncbi:MAG TPA: radical SAM protein, partial [Thermoanaerobaculia bacterium]|nr:radical SAM protein [Thermoanaerobaculia bacterium]